MQTETEKIKAVAMTSGGLDSTLAIKMLCELGIDVRPVNFYTGFCMAEQRRRLGIAPCEEKTLPPDDEAVRTSPGTHAPIQTIDVSEDFLKIITQPKHGYGSSANPCVDCKIFMLRRAAEYMKEIGAKFVVTGEVLGQRPMSQRRDTFPLMEKETGLKGLILRPLTAQRITPTIPEQEGWVDREKLGNISGRSRKPQMALAAAYGITHYPQPAGGCLLTDETYGRRFHELLAHRTDKTLNTEDVVLLATGRHFRIHPDLKIIVGRNHEENETLRHFLDHYWACAVPEIPGPTTLIQGGPVSEENRRCIAEITSRYSDAKNQDNVRVSFFTRIKDAEDYPALEVIPLTDFRLLDKLRI